jgi:hypothetical protein
VLIITRFIALGTLVGLYALSPMVGVGLLATGTGYIVGQRVFKAF